MVSTAAFVHAGVVQISWANLAVILVMVVLFALALLLPFPQGAGPADGKEIDHDLG